MVNKFFGDFLVLAAFVSLISNAAGGKTCSNISPIADLCCKSYETCCKDGCCQFANAKCCPNNKCCPTTHPTCCPDGKCCPSANPICCSNHCCPTTYATCCGVGCCSNAYPVCCSTYCCPGGTTCCAGKCCFYGRRSVDNAPNHPLLEALSDGVVSSKEVEIVHPDKDDKDTSGVIKLAKGDISFRGTCNSFYQEIINEGYYQCRYYDSKGIAKIGVGFNLEKTGAKSRIQAIGANHDRLLNGQECLDYYQIQTLFEQDMNEAVSCAISFTPNWSSLSIGPKSALADIAFDIGCTAFNTFTCLRNAVGRLDFQWAAEEIKNLDWCKLYGIRCARDVACMKQ